MSMRSIICQGVHAMCFVVSSITWIIIIPACIDRTRIHPGTWHQCSLIYQVGDSSIPRIWYSYEVGDSSIPRIWNSYVLLRQLVRVPTIRTRYLVLVQVQNREQQQRLLSLLFLLREYQHDIQFNGLLLFYYVRLFYYHGTWIPAWWYNSMDCCSKADRNRGAWERDLAGS